MNETHLIEIERVRAEAARHLADHEIACERRYGELQGTSKNSPFSGVVDLESG